MSTDEAKLEMLRRHVRQGAEHIADQRARVSRLKEHGLPTEQAEDLLANFEDLQRQHEAQLAEVEGAQRH